MKKEKVTTNKVTSKLEKVLWAVLTVFKKIMPQK